MTNGANWSPASGAVAYRNGASADEGTTIISKRFTFEAAHALPQVPLEHKCARVHGHSYQVTVHVVGPINSRGWVVDFADINTLWEPLHDTLDHQLLNEVDGLENPTVERLAAWIWAALAPDLDDGERSLVAVEVAETASARATFLAPGVNIAGWLGAKAQAER